MVIVRSVFLQVTEECGDIAMVLIQNKIDLLEEAVIEPSEAEELARRLKLKFYRTSVKDDYNVDEVFLYLAQRHMEIVSKMEGLETDVVEQQTIGMFSAEGTEQKQNGPDEHSDKPKGKRKKESKKDEKSTDQPFQLRPNKVRTDGKKKTLFSCTIL
jgi:Ras-related protein Rab-23